jgi:leucyl/phenylalanyl-tRNA---protein transferase
MSIETVEFAMSAAETERQLKAIFSNPRGETVEGVLVAGGHMTPELLITAYNNGIFPWPHEGYPLLWFCPDERGVIELSEIHFPKSFQKWLKKHRCEFTITMNQDFLNVVKNCRAAVRSGQKGSWINDEIETNYFMLHQMGHAYSLEVWRGPKLVGGIYGVQSKKYFSCESMFHLESNTSKLALYELLEFLKKSGQTWLDIQMVTDVSGSFGGKYITKDEFLKRLGV